MKTWVTCWLIGFVLCFAFGANELCSAGEAADVIQVGSTWRDNAGHTLTILERNGGTYRGRFAKNDQFIRDVTGSTAGNKISWLARDVTPIKGGPGGDNFGTITGDKIDFKFTGNDGKIARVGYTLTRVSGGNGSRAMGPSGIDPATLGGLIKANRGNLVFLKGENGAGSGFIAKVGDVNYLFTNAHVAAGVKGASCKTLDGSAVEASSPVVAVEHDIFRLTVPAGGTSLEVMDHVDAKAAVGDDIAVLGNAEGAGVVTPITGKIVGLGPNLVEVDAPFVPGNSGSPIIHLKSGQVIGVATYAMIRKYDPATNQPIKEPVIRRFGYRLDSVKTWQSVNWPVFAAQAVAMESIGKRTGELEKLISDIAQHHKITRTLHTDPAIKGPIDLWFADRERQLSPSDRTMSDQNFTARLKSACLNDLAEARPSLTYDYFQRELAEQQRYRDSIVSALDALQFLKASSKK